MGLSVLTTRLNRRDLGASPGTILLALDELRQIQDEIEAALVGPLLTVQR